MTSAARGAGGGRPLRQAVASRRAAAARSSATAADHLGDRAGVGGQDLRPQRAVARRDPRDVTQSLPGQPEGVGGHRGRRQPRRHRGRDQMRRVRDQRHPLVMRFRVGDHRVGAAGQDERGHRLHRGWRRLGQRAQRPGPAEEQIGLRGRGPVPFPPGQRMPGHVAARDRNRARGPAGPAAPSRWPHRCTHPRRAYSCARASAAATAAGGIASTATSAIPLASRRSGTTVPAPRSAASWAVA